jgi:hypothetical protein
MKKIISVSLWGQDRRYYAGIIENVKLRDKYLQDWSYRIYCNTDSYLTDYVDKFKSYNVDIVILNTDWYGMFWRYIPSIEEDNIVIFRDSDTRLIEKEVRYLTEWLDSDKKYSIMRDHPRHNDFPMLGGMWGIKGKLSPNHVKSMGIYALNHVYLADQIWLQSCVYGDIKSDAFIHEYDGKNCSYEFIGQGYDENNKPIYPWN